MDSPLDSSIGIVAYLALFAGVGFVFVFVNLLLGKFLRPSDPHEEKLEIYECGEPTIGSSFVQFDLRFYVVALVFIIFDVEVAFLFPWATVFGKATHLSSPSAQVAEMGADGRIALTASARSLYRELGVREPSAPAAADVGTASNQIKQGARELAWVSMLAVSFFFAVLLIGFAYEWKTGALDWVRAVTRERRASLQRPPPSTATSQQSVLSA
jgi:NADH-quinone oxidoreductase subunit A